MSLTHRHEPYFDEYLIQDWNGYWRIQFHPPSRRLRDYRIKFNEVPDSSGHVHGALDGVGDRYALPLDPANLQGDAVPLKMTPERALGRSLRDKDARASSAF